MYFFLICLILLIVGYFTYGVVIEKIVGIDRNAITPAYELRDDEDFVPLSRKKVLLIQFLNIAGLGPIFGAIQGALFGPVAFIWIVFGSIFAGAVHDFFSGYLSLKYKGKDISIIIGKIFGKVFRNLMGLLCIIILVLITAVFASGSASLLYTISHIDRVFWVILIFIYFFLSVIFPIDKIIGRIYPFIGAYFLIMTIIVFIAILISPDYIIPEITTQNLYFSNHPIFPFICVTIACGAISGFHATQSPIMAKCVKNEMDVRPVFYGSMILEGIVALIWAAIAMAFFNFQPQMTIFWGSNPSIAVASFSQSLLGTFGLILSVIAIVILPITSGDTALRSARSIIVDYFNLKSHTLKDKLKIAIPITLTSFLLTFVNFTFIWRYFSWVQGLLAMMVLWTATIYLKNNKKFYMVTLLPAFFMMVVCIAYILQAPEGLGLNGFISNIIGIIVAIVASVFILVKKGKD